MVYFLDWEKKLLSHIRFIYIYEAVLLGVDEPTDVIPFLLSHIACEPCFHEALVIMWVSFCRVGIYALLCFFLSRLNLMSWVVGQFGTGQFGTGQFGTRTIWHQDNLAPT